MSAARGFAVRVVGVGRRVVSGDCPTPSGWGQLAVPLGSRSQGKPSNNALHLTPVVGFSSLTSAFAPAQVSFGVRLLYMAFAVSQPEKQKMNKILLLIGLSIVLMGYTLAVAKNSFSQPVQPYQSPDQRSEWVAKCLRQINTIKPGSTQQEFDRLFDIAGGVSDGNTYSFRQCPYFKVSAKFKSGKVVSISKAYLDEVYYN